jgi:acetyltransferase-like isoleucine patch superfamily enzyme
VTNARWTLNNDWYAGGIPANVSVGANVYLDTSYSFAAFHSRKSPGLELGNSSGVYDRTNFNVGPEGVVTVGPYTCLNATTFVCNDRITIGAHCLLAWGVVLTDTWACGSPPMGVRRKALRAAAVDSLRVLPPVSPPRPVILEDNVWVGFDSVIMPGVTLGRGCIVGCKTVVTADVPPYAVVVGCPPRVVRTLEPDDTEIAALNARDRCLRRRDAMEVAGGE